MSFSRRKLLMLGGGAAALAAIPVGQHVAWGMKDFTRDDYAPGLPETPAGEKAWTNWSGIARATPKDIFVPSDEDALAEFILKANGRVRPVGSGHSFTSLVPCEDTIVDVSRFAGVYSYDTETQTATIGAGTRLRQAARDLAAVGLAFHNLPDIDVQTLAGMFSTATHGTGLKLKALHDQIIGFRIVLANGEVRDVTRTSDPDLFSAGKVSLGALGVITQYTLQLTTAFNLRRRVWVEEIDSIVDRAEDLAAQHHAFEFYYFPNTGYAAGISHDVFDGEIKGRAPSEDEDLLADLKDLRDMFGWQPWLRRKIIGGAIPKGVVEDVTDESWRLLSTSRPTKFNEVEYHIPHKNGVKAIRDTIAFLDARKDVYFPAEFRWTGQDDAMLSPFNDGTRVSIATHAAVDEPYQYLLDDLQPIHRANGGRPHWGKLHSLGKEELSDLYSDFDTFLDIRRALDPQGKFLNAHLADLFGETVDA